MTLQLAARIAIFSFVVTSMLAVGLALTPSQIAASLRSRRLLGSALFANYVVVPAFAYAITRMVTLDRSSAIGLLLLGTAAGAPFLPKLAELAKADLAFSVGLVVLLMTFTIVYMPLVLPLLVPGAHVSPWSVGKPLLTVMAPPLALGLLLRARLEAFARFWEPPLRHISTFALIVAIVLVLAAYSREVAQVSFKVIACAVLLILFSLASGFLLGGRTFALRNVVAFGTAQRDLSAALLVAVETFSDPRITAILFAALLAGIFIELPLALALGRFSSRLARASA